MTVEKRCAKCNTILIDDVEFCNNCGAKIEITREMVFEDVFCSECGAKVNTEFNFCSECGNPLMIEKKNATAPPSAYENIFCPECGSMTSTEFEFCAECGKPLGINKESNPMLGITPSQGMKYHKPFKMPIKPLLIGTAALIIITGIIFSANALFFSNGSSSDAKYILYAKDREFQFAFIPGAKRFQLTERFYDSSVTPSLYDFNEYANAILISDDDRYIFYPDRINNNEMIYYWRDLKADNTKNDTATRIDREITALPQITKDGTKFFYIKGDERRLYIYDLKSGESANLVRDVNYFYINDIGDYLIYQVYKDGEYSVYEMTIQGLVGESNRIKLDAWVNEAFANDRKVFYQNEDNDLFYKEFNKDEVRISREVDRIVSIVDGSSVYIIKSEEVINKLSIYVNDDLGDDVDEDFKESLYEMLDDEENAISFYADNLYFWNPSSPSGGMLVASDLADGYNIYQSPKSSKTPLVVYQKNSLTTGGNIKLSDYISTSYNISPYDVIWGIRDDLYYSREASDYFYIAYEEKESELDCYKARNFAISANGVICYLDKYNDSKNYGTLKSISVSSGALTKPTKIDDDVMVFLFGNANINIYYFKDVKNNIGDMYLNAQNIAQDVYISSLYNFKGSETFLYFNNYSNRNDYGSLNFYNGGKNTKIADDVSFFTPINEKNIAYIKDYNNNRQRGDLMLYDSEGKTISVDTDVTMLIWNPKMTR